MFVRYEPQFTIMGFKHHTTGYRNYDPEKKDLNDVAFSVQSGNKKQLLDHLKHQENIGKEQIKALSVLMKDKERGLVDVSGGFIATNHY